ncbi:hypothetical protein AB0G95_21780 [Streptomyces virginiae]|uniref:hypothetical protein n=1 Tax=Streptomyces virginiae TaxID=1961 RepID=UPI00341E0709
MPNQPDPEHPFPSTVGARVPRPDWADDDQGNHDGGRISRAVEDWRRATGR